MIGTRLAASLATRAYRSRALARVFFGIDFLPRGSKDYYYDISTLVVVRRVARMLGPGRRLLDLGTGSYGVIGLSLWKKTGCDVTCCDIDPELVASTRRNIELNEAPISVVESDLFANVPGPFDVVTFNPPYIATSFGDRWNVDARQSQWDGGEEGSDAVAPFLASVAARDHSVTACLAMNTIFVKRDRIRAMVADQPELELVETYRAPVLPIELHTIENRHARSK